MATSKSRWVNGESCWVVSASMHAVLPGVISVDYRRSGGKYPQVFVIVTKPNGHFGTYGYKPSALFERMDEAYDELRRLLRCDIAGQEDRITRLERQLSAARTKLRKLRKVDANG